MVTVESMTTGEEMTTVTVGVDYLTGSPPPVRSFYFATYDVDLVPGEAGWKVAAVRKVAVS